MKGTMMKLAMVQTHRISSEYLAEVKALFPL